MRKIEYNDLLISSLIGKIHQGDWIDVEQLFFELLIKNQSKITELNRGIEQLGEKLKEYLRSLRYTQLGNTQSLTLVDRMFDPLYNESSEVIHDEMKPVLPDKTLLLNFNYTPALSILLGETMYLGTDILHVHGSIISQKPLIFGYGDDSHPAYVDLENKGNNALMKNIKSFHYSRGFEYHRMLAFIESSEYEVFIVGHSCGLSDRVLLKQIFEHIKCKAIQIFHRQGIPNDFQDRHINVSRHFSDKLRMRKIVLPENLNTCFP